jgi:hypothetical protein
MLAKKGRFCPQSAFGVPPQTLRWGQKGVNWAPKDGLEGHADNLGRELGVIGQLVGSFGAIGGCFASIPRLFEVP